VARWPQYRAGQVAAGQRPRRLLLTALSGLAFCRSRMALPMVQYSSMSAVLTTRRGGPLCGPNLGFQLSQQARIVASEPDQGRARERAGAAPSNFELTLPVEDSELAGQLAKDPYVFDFLGLSGRVAERDLEAALIARLRYTLLELGTGFAFVGQQVHLDVGGDDFYIDLLFFNIPQVRYVVVELKIAKFEPEFVGKLGFYIAAVDDRLRDPARHAPTVGILMCAGRNDTVVRYALSGAAQPMAVAGYTYDALPAGERAALPSDTRVAAALEAPVDVDGRQMTLAEYLESAGAEPWAGPGHAND